MPAATTQSTVYVIILDVTINLDVAGVNNFSLSIDPDPNALYSIQIGKILSVTEAPLSAIWSLVLPLVQGMIYEGLVQGDHVTVQHRSPTGQSITTGVTAFINEVVRSAG
jgi:hypothetical protein